MMEIGTDPRQNPYYIGSLILKSFQESGRKNCDVIELFSDVTTRSKCSMKMFILALDWLFITETITQGADGVIEYVA